MQRINFRGLGLIWVTFSQSILFLCEAIFKGVSHSMSDRHIRRFSKRLLAMAGAHLEVFYSERLDKTQPCVYMSNHQSVMDIPVMMEAVPQSLRMVAKEGLFKVPLFGAAMARAGFIPIDRKNITKSKAQLNYAKNKLKEGFSIWIAPEGTRSRTLELLPFKKGGFHVALALGIPIVPAYIQGAAEVVPSDSLKVSVDKKIGVYFGHPVSTDGLSSQQMPVLMKQVREAILELEKNK